VEFWPYGLRLFGADAKEFLDTLCDAGFALWNLNERRGEMARTGVAELLVEYPPTLDAATNLFCTRR
jgi:hypothetical protein